MMPAFPGSITLDQFDTVVHPHVDCTLEMINGASPSFLKSKVWVTTVPATTLPKSYSDLINTIFAAPEFVEPAGAFGAGDVEGFSVPMTTPREPATTRQ